MSERRYKDVSTETMHLRIAKTMERINRLLALSAPDLILKNEMDILNERMAEMIMRAPTMIDPGDAGIEEDTL